jgi:hypothetical protein
VRRLGQIKKVRSMRSDSSAKLNMKRIPTVWRLEVPQKIEHQDGARNEVVKIFYACKDHETVLAIEISDQTGKVGEQSHYTNPQAEH